jgi:CubicO group peptidase (beta-lactamase class C family)
MTKRHGLAGIPAAVLSPPKLFAAQSKHSQTGPRGTGNPGKWYGRRTNPSGRKAMKFVRPLLLAALLIGGASLAVAQELRPVEHPEQLGFSVSRLQRLTQAYQGYVDRGELPGAVLLIAVGDKIAYLQAVGFQDREKKIPMKTDAIFRLASMTKPIISVAAMMCSAASSKWSLGWT